MRMLFFRYAYKDIVCIIIIHLHRIAIGIHCIAPCNCGILVRCGIYDNLFRGGTLSNIVIVYNTYCTTIFCHVKHVVQKIFPSHIITNYYPVVLTVYSIHYCLVFLFRHSCHKTIPLSLRI